MGKIRLITIGKVLKPKGLKGEVKVSPAAIPLDDYGNLGTVILDLGKEEKAMHVESASHNNKFVYLKFSSITSVEEAETLRDGLIKIEENRLGALPDNTFYPDELEGFTAVDETGKLIGRIQEVVSYPSCDALEVLLPNGKELLVPMTKNVIREIRVEKKEIALFANQVEALLQNP